MAKHKVVTTDAEIDAALERARVLPAEPHVLAVEYRSGMGLDLLILKLSDGSRQVIPREQLEGLAGATRQQIANVEILGGGTGLHWPALDLDYYVPALLNHVYGTKRWMAELGRRGGSTVSEAKQTAAQANGRKGGRPRKDLGAGSGLRRSA